MYFTAKRTPLHVTLVSLFAFFALAASPEVQAQSSPSGPIQFSVELNGGAAFYGHFLEQRVGESAGGISERELTAQTGLSLGAALGVRLFDKNVVRLSVDYLPSQLEYQDDTGTGSDALDSGPLGDLRLFATSLEIERTFTQWGRLAPYASVGLSGGWWNLAEETERIRSGTDQQTLFRWGGTSGLGVRVSLTPSFSLNLEANALSLGNPFDGAKAFRAASASASFEEPTSVRVLRLRGGLRYLF